MFCFLLKHTLITLTQESGIETFAYKIHINIFFKAALKRCNWFRFFARHRRKINMDGNGAHFMVRPQPNAAGYAIKIVTSQRYQPSPDIAHNTHSVRFYLHNAFKIVLCARNQINPKHIAFEWKKSRNFMHSMHFNYKLMPVLHLPE